MRAHEVSVSYGDKQALFDINLTIPERSVVAFIGPSAPGATLGQLAEGTKSPG